MMNYTDIEKSQIEALKKIKADLKNGIIGWHDRGQALFPFNPVSNVSYTGVNRFLLYNELDASKYEKSYWCTLKQAQKAGWKLKPDEKSVTLARVNNLDDKKAQQDYVTFDVYNVSQFNNVKLNEPSYSDKQLIEIGSYFKSETISPEKYEDKKEYVRACIHEAVSKVIANTQSMRFDMAESFVCNSFGIGTSNQQVNIDEWNKKIDSVNDYLINSIDSAEVAYRKVIGEYNKNKIYDEVAENMEKFYVLLDQPSMTHEKILSILKNENDRKNMVKELTSLYVNLKNRNNVRDLIFIGRTVSSISKTDKSKDAYVYTMEKEILYLEKNSRVDFGKNFETHPYVLANSISNAASDILKMKSEDIFDKLKSEDGRSEIINLLKDNYSKQLSKGVSSVDELKLINGIMKDVIVLEYPNLVKQKKQQRSDSKSYKQKENTQQKKTNSRRNSRKR